MKKMKKLASLVLALAMALTLAVPAMAATVTVPTSLSGHTFVAYQIFTGTQSTSEGDLGDVKWGNGINKKDFLDALQGVEGTFNVTVDGGVPANAFAGLTVENPVAIAAAMGNFADNSDAANLIAKLAYNNKIKDNEISLDESVNTLPDGYYLIVDSKGGPINGGNSAYNAALLQVTDTIEITLKTDVPQVEKKVKENAQYIANEGYGTGYNDVADYNIGDIVPFAFYSKVPDMTYYDTYEYTFHDSMSAGLTLNESSIVVTVGTKTLTEIGEDGKGDYTVTKVAHKHGDKDCTFQINIPNLKSIAAKGDDIKVAFNATLNENAVIGLPGNPNEVMLEYSNNPNDEGNGKTEWDKVIVFTYELDVNKVDGAKHETKLDAEFVLYRGSDDSKEYVKVDADGKVDRWVTDKSQASTLKSGDDGLFKVIGLDDGTYYLEETKAPAGYNLLAEPITVVVDATTANGQNWNGTPGEALTKLNVTADGKAGTVSNGIGTITVENNSGATLPETGGMGTTLFYALGAVLVIGAGVAMVTKKRMA